MGTPGPGFRRALVVAVTLLAALPAAATAAGGALVLDPASLAAFGWHPAARDGSNELSSYAFVLSSAPAAHRVAIAFRRVHHGQALNVGRDGAVAQRGSGSATVFSFLFRAGARIGLLDVCAGTSDAGTAAEFAPLANARLSSALPATALAKILDQIRPDGSISKQTALQAFALSYGPVPGVPSPGGAATPAPWSGDLAGAWALRYRTRVSPRPVSPYATGHAQILVGPLVHIDVTGHARLSSKYNYTDLGNGWFCLEAGGCECPAESGYVSKGGKDGFLAVGLQSPSVGDAAGRVAGGDFTCKKPVP